MFGLPLIVRHAVDDFPSGCVFQREAALLGFRAVPLGQAVTTEACKVHEVDVLDVRALLEVRNETAKGRGF